MLLIVCRHGDTFEPEQTPVWVGSRNDLPLAKNGKLQAQNTASALAGSKLQSPIVYCGPLVRTRDYAAVLAATLGLGPPKIDAALIEIDYGGWTGLNNEQLATRYGKPMLEAWENRGQFPPAGIWGETEEHVRARVGQFLSRLRSLHDESQAIVAVTSNGVLRVLCQHFVLKPKPGGKETKVRTGHSGVLEMSESGLVIRGWNLTAEDLRSMLVNPNKHQAPTR